MTLDSNLLVAFANIYIYLKQQYNKQQYENKLGICTNNALGKQQDAGEDATFTHNIHLCQVELHSMK